MNKLFPKICSIFEIIHLFRKCLIYETYVTVLLTQFRKENNGVRQFLSISGHLNVNIYHTCINKICHVFKSDLDQSTWSISKTENRLILYIQKLINQSKYLNSTRTVKSNTCNNNDFKYLYFKYNVHSAGQHRSPEQQYCYLDMYVKYT